MGADEWVLEADTDYLCPGFGGSFLAYVVGWICLALIPVGIPLIIGRELYNNRDVINPGGKNALHARVPALYAKQAAALAEIDKRLDRIHNAIVAVDGNHVDGVDGEHGHLGEHAEHEGYGIVHATVHRLHQEMKEVSFERQVAARPPPRNLEYVGIVHLKAIVQYYKPVRS